MSLFQVVYKIVPRVIGTGTTDSRQITNLRTSPYDPEKRGNRKDKTGKQSVKTEKSDFSAVKSHFYHS